MLQRGGATVYGSSSCAPGTKVTVNLREQVNGRGVVGTTVAINTDKTWKLTLKTPSEPTTNEFKLEIIDCDDNQSIENVLIGEVYLCAGQSNLNFATINPKHFDAGEFNKFKASVPSHPKIRYWFATREPPVDKTFKTTLESGSKNRRWEYDVLDGANSNGPSVSCTLQAYQIQDLFLKFQNVNVPVGFMDIARGGSKISDWMLYIHEDDKTCGGTNLPYSKYPECFDSGHSSRCFSYWYNLFWPIKDMTFSALFWWQGEREVRFDGQTSQPNVPFETYACQQGIFVKIWRETMGYDIPFIGTALLDEHDSLISAGSNIHKMRLQQQLAFERIPNSAYVITNDRSLIWNTHTNLREDIGKRHALAYMKLVHEINIATPKGPTLTGEVERVTYNGATWLRLLMEPDTSHQLVLEPTSSCDICCNGNESPFQVLINGNFVYIPAADVIPDVTAAYIKVPEGVITGIGYHYDRFNQCMMYNNFECTVGKLPGGTQYIEYPNIKNGNVLPGQTKWGDRERCPQVGYPTASPTRSPTFPPNRPSNAPTRRPTGSPTERPTLPPGVVLFENPEMSGYDCRAPRQKRDSWAHVTQQALGGKHYNFCLDSDGAFNTIPTNNNPNSVKNWFYNYDRGRIFPDGLDNAISLGAESPDEADCEARCKAQPLCNGFTWYKSNLNCHLMIGCERIENDAATVTRWRTSFPSGFIAKSAKIGQMCSNAEVAAIPLTSAPVKPEECFHRCQPFKATHFVLDHDLQCHCHIGCDYADEAWSITYEFLENDIITDRPTRAPTKSPTLPQPTISPTVSPSWSPTGGPTLRPTFGPTLRPTAFPTRSPTLPPSPYANFDAVVHHVSTNAFPQSVVVLGLVGVIAGFIFLF